MNGEDVYDVAIHVWCPLCDAAHEPCEPHEDDLRYTCSTCSETIEFADEPDNIDSTSPRHPWCFPVEKSNV